MSRLSPEANRGSGKKYENVDVESFLYGRSENLLGVVWEKRKNEEHFKGGDFIGPKLAIKVKNRGEK